MNPHSKPQAVADVIALANSTHAAFAAAAPPRAMPSNLLTRTPLIERLDAALTVKLTLLEAPAGYGKSTALMQWTQRLTEERACVHWLDAGMLAAEADAFRCLLAHCRNGFGGPAGAGRRTTLPQVLILDEYHLVAAPEADRRLCQLIDQADAGTHLVVAARCRPRISLAKRVAAGQAATIDAPQLRFSPAEAAQWLAADAQQAAPDGEIERIFAGWPVGLACFKAWLARHPGGRATAYLESFPKEIADFLFEEVYESLAPALRSFLRRLSIVASATRELADGLNGGEDSSAHLNELTSRNLFLSESRSPVTGDYVYRLHELFRRLLEQEALRDGEIDVRALHRTAARWFSEHGEFAHAAFHARRAEDIQSAAQLMEAAGALRIGMRDGLPSLQHFLRQIPAESVHQFPRVDLAHTFYLLKVGQVREALVRLEHLGPAAARQHPGIGGWAQGSELERDVWMIERFLDIFLDRLLPEHEERQISQALPAIPNSDPFHKGLLNALLFFSLLRRGQLPEAASAARRCRLWSIDMGAPYAMFYSSLHLGTACLHQGRLSEARTYFESADRTAVEALNGEPAPKAQSRTFLGALLYESNDVSSADIHLRDVLQVIDHIEAWFEVLAAALLTAASIRCLQGDLDAAGAVLDRACEIAERKRIPRLALAAELKRAELLALHGHAERAAGILFNAGVRLEGERLSCPETFTWREQGPACITYARILMHRQQCAQSIALLESLRAACARHGRGLLDIKALVVLALAALADGQPRRATRYVNDAIEAGMKEGLKQCFVEEGAAMGRLLNTAIRTQGLASMRFATIAFVSELLTALRHPAEQRCADDSGAILSPREMDILRSLSNRQSNKTIARQLRIAENTVKFHLRNIYEKLGVNSRAMAVAVARRLALIPDAT